MSKLSNKIKKLFTAVGMVTVIAASLTGCGKKADKELTVINYGEYMDPAVLEDFTKETGIKVNYEEALTPEEMYTKYKSGAIKTECSYRS